MLVVIVGQGGLRALCGTEHDGMPLDVTFLCIILHETGILEHVTRTGSTAEAGIQEHHDTLGLHLVKLTVELVQAVARLKVGTRGIRRQEIGTSCLGVGNAVPGVVEDDVVGVGRVLGNLLQETYLLLDFGEGGILTQMHILTGHAEHLAAVLLYGIGIVVGEAHLTLVLVLLVSDGHNIRVGVLDAQHRDVLVDVRG